MIAALTLALAFSAVLIGSAQATDRPDNRAGIRGIGSQSTDVSDVFTRAVARAHAVHTVRPDDRAGLRGAGSTPASTPIAPTDVFERAVLRHNASAAPRPDDRAGLRGTGTEVADNAPIATTASTGFVDVQQIDYLARRSEIDVRGAGISSLGEARIGVRRGHVLE